MKKIIFLDTETTGNEPVKDFLCQLAWKTSEETFCELFKPPIPIPPEASAVTHITNKHVVDKKAFQESSNYGAIKLMLEDPTAVMVAHNARFDEEIIKKEGITPAHTICTLRVARALDTKNVIPQYKLQYLRYYLDIEIKAEAHDALGDVLVLEQLYKRLLDKIMKPARNADGIASAGGEENLTEEEAIEKMIEISSRPSLMNSFPFGKYNGKTIEEVKNIDPGYLDWMLGQKELNPDNEEDWIYTLKYHLGKL
ncbi:MAG: exonuclease domain-containing protein [Patescibacteria group bacterium]